jgi:hypothetical protein
MRLYGMVGWKNDGLQMPLFDLNDTAGIADFILREIGL